MAERGSTPLLNYAVRNCRPIRFPATCLSFALGVVRPFEFCNTMARGSAIPRQKTHNITFQLRSLCYRWHPWYGRDLLTRAATGVRADISYLCTIPDAPVGAMLVEIPRWMFDSSDCAAMRLGELAHVDCTALQALKGMLAAKST